MITTSSRGTLRTFVLLVAACFISTSNAFVAPTPKVASQTTTTTIHMSFFKDIFGNAFENDASLDRDKTKGQYDGPDDGDDSMSVGRLINNNDLTETQKRWRELQQNKGGIATPQLLLTNSQWKLNLFLTGIPDRDPSNDLFASKVNISSRDRKVGLMVPEEPTVSGVLITLLEDGVVQVESDSEFIDSSSSTEGSAWKVSDDGSRVRICLNVMGYQRTVQTKGSIQKVFWSEEEGQSTQTSSAYTIPAGPMYGDASLQSTRPGVLQWDDGILQVEKAAGLLGAGSKMVPCGRFSALRVDNQ